MGRLALAATVLGAALTASAAPAGAAPRLEVRWEGSGGAPVIRAETVSSGVRVADYGAGTDCGLASGMPCATHVPGARWEEADVAGRYRAKTISLFVDAPWSAFSYSISNIPLYDFSMPSAPMQGTATLYQADGRKLEESFSLAAGFATQLRDYVPPPPRKLEWREAERSVAKRALRVGRSRLVRLRGLNFTCGNMSDRPCVIHGFAAAERPDPFCLRHRCPQQGVVYRPALSRFRLVIPAGQTRSPVTIKLSRSGLRYVKRHRRVRMFVRLFYAISGEEKPACEQTTPDTCREHRTSTVRKLRYRP